MRFRYIFGHLLLCPALVHARLRQRELRNAALATNRSPKVVSISLGPTGSNC